MTPRKPSKAQIKTACEIMSPHSDVFENDNAELDFDICIEHIAQALADERAAAIEECLLALDEMLQPLADESTHSEIRDTDDGARVLTWTYRQESLSKVMEKALKMRALLSADGSGGG